MKREIKYRGKVKDNVFKWVYGFVVMESPADARIVEAREDGDWYIVTPETVSQYIGIEDKDGREIYEDDILKDKWGRLGVVKWKNESAAFIMEFLNPEDPVLRGLLFSSDCLKHAHIEVVGNIHDNREYFENKEGGKK